MLVVSVQQSARHIYRRDVRAIARPIPYASSSSLFGSVATITRIALNARHKQPASERQQHQ
jgi:hypothetical protein